MKEKVKFNNLSPALKTAIILLWIMLGFQFIGFMWGFFIGLYF